MWSPAGGPMPNARSPRWRRDRARACSDACAIWAGVSSSDAEGGDQIDRHRRDLEPEAREPGADDCRALPIESGSVRGTRGLGAADRLVQAAEPATPFVPAASQFRRRRGRGHRHRAALAAIDAAARRGPRRAGGRTGDCGSASRASEVTAVLGHHEDDVAASLAALGLGVTAADERRSIERLLAAFTGQVLDKLGTADGVVDAEEHEHVGRLRGARGRTGRRRSRDAGRAGGTAGRRPRCTE